MRIRTGNLRRKRADRRRQPLSRLGLRRRPAVPVSIEVTVQIRPSTWTAEDIHAALEMDLHGQVRTPENVKGALISIIREIIPPPEVIVSASR